MSVKDERHDKAVPSGDGAVLRIVGDSGARHEPRPLATRDAWRLTVGGEVAEPRVLSLDELLALEPEPIEVTHDITCVSAAKIAPGGGLVRFGGVRFQTLADLVAPRPWPGGGELGPSVELISRAPATVGPRGERHHTFMPLADCLDPASGVLLAATLDGEPLPYANGGPLRSVVGPAFFFYKAIKWLEEIRFVHRPLEECRGTWEEYSGYHVRARVDLNERFEPRMHRIVAVDAGEDDAPPADTLELIPADRWAEVFEEMQARRDLSRLSAAQLHKMFGA
ncbi:MAG: molybdopterin-dependent oxidoreductase, partial [Acidobacteria bacterium]|nr:molybdopterin-dependent oxidoreductase [Acidobacteriota bacterium]